MTPEQITEALDEIISNIADAHILIARLGKQMAGGPSGDMDVVYGDIWSDAGLAAMHKSLRLMESQLVRAQNITLPEHFDRLRATRAPDPDHLREDRDERRAIAKEHGE